MCVFKRRWRLSPHAGWLLCLHTHPNISGRNKKAAARYFMYMTYVCMYVCMYVYVCTYVPPVVFFWLLYVRCDLYFHTMDVTLRRNGNFCDADSFLTGFPAWRSSAYVSQCFELTDSVHEFSWWYVFKSCQPLLHHYCYVCIYPLGMIWCHSLQSL